MFSVSDVKINAPAKRWVGSDKVFGTRPTHLNRRALVAPGRRKARVPSTVVYLSPAEYLSLS
jgi:hypothetical protein